MKHKLMSIAVVVGSIGLAGCEVDLLTAFYGPSKVQVEPPPGARIVNVNYGEWAWTPDAKSIVYSVAGANTDVPLSLEVVDVETGAKRVLATTLAPGELLSSPRFTVGTEFVYYEVSSPSTTLRERYRSRIDGTGLRELVVDSVPFGRPLTWPSRDEKLVAWIEPASPGASYSLVVLDLATRVREKYALTLFADRVTWSPDNSSLIAGETYQVIGPWTTYQWVERIPKRVTLWSPTNAPGTGAFNTGTIGWMGSTPMLQVVDAKSITRYTIGSTSKVLLATLADGAKSAGSTADFETTVISWSPCMRAGMGWQGCEAFGNRAERVDATTGEGEEVLKFIGAGSVDGRISPDGRWLAFSYMYCGPGCRSTESGLYVVDIRQQ
jgi:hypothetical protein